ncbi:uncharacterized protein DS421_20g694010 [Arachis hypogaea]|nr:uncharacterized protein DS421_20g694010 [Arachis hypogaea]
MPPKKRHGGTVGAPDTAESNRAVSSPLGALRQRPRSQRIADRREGEIPRERVQENPAVREAQPDLAAELRGMNQTLNAVLQVLTNQNRGEARLPNAPNPQPHRVHQLFGDQEPPIEKYLMHEKLVSEQISLRQVYRICRQVKTHNRVRSNPTGID